jgi:hypothetical protein
MHAQGPGWSLAWASDQAKLARPSPNLYRLVRPNLKKEKIEIKNWAWTSGPAGPIFFILVPFILIFRQTSPFLM